MTLRDLKGNLAAGFKRLRSPVDTRDALVFGGLASAGYGISMIYPPAAWIFCGLVVFWLGMR